MNSVGQLFLRDPEGFKKIFQQDLAGVRSGTPGRHSDHNSKTSLKERSVIIDYLDPGRERSIPFKTDPILIVDADTVLPGAIALQSL